MLDRASFVIVTESRLGLQQHKGLNLGQREASLRRIYPLTDQAST